MDKGGGANVLGSPFMALGHLIGTLTNLPKFPGVTAGEVVTTGTFTRALPIKQGETWGTELYGINLSALTITF